MRESKRGSRTGSSAQSPGIPRIVLPPLERLRLARAGALASVVETETYADTISCWIRYRPSQAILTALWRKNAGRAVTPMDCPRGFAVALQRPTAAARQFIATLDPKHTVFAYHLAVDFVCETTEDALKVEAFIRQHLVQLYRRDEHQITVYKTTTYFRGANRTARNIVLYSDRPSKLSDRPCCHLEFRLASRNSCKSFGVYQATDDIEDLAGFLDRYGYLAQPVPATLIDLVERSIVPGNARFEWTGITEEQWALMHFAEDLQLRGLKSVEAIVGSVQAQNWRDWSLMRQLQPRNFGLVKMPLSGLLGQGAMIRRHGCSL